MKRSQAFPSSYLGKDDLPTARVVTIDTVVQERIKGDNGEEDKAVMHFRGDVKPMIVNNTNWMTIEDVYGDESDNWAGKPIELYVDPSVSFGGKRVGGVRVRVPQQQSSPAAAPAPATNGGPVSPKMSAIKAFAAKTPSLSSADRNKKWAEAFAEVYAGRAMSELQDDEWTAYADKITNEYSEEMGFIPF